MITIIAAIDQQNGLGFENNLLFRLPADLKRFKSLTTGHTVVMGRKTFDSLPKGALPNRRNIVLSRNKGLTCPGAEVFGSLQEALEHCTGQEEVFVMGGASLYSQAMEMADVLQITEIHATAPKADVFFPAIDTKLWKEKSREPHLHDEKHPCDYDFVEYIKVKTN